MTINDIINTEKISLLGEIPDIKNNKKYVRHCSICQRTMEPVRKIELIKGITAITSGILSQDCYETYFKDDIFMLNDIEEYNFEYKTCKGFYDIK